MDSIPFSPPNPYQTPLSTSDPQIPLFNLSILQQKVDSLRRSLSLWLDSDTPIASEQIDLASTEIASSIQQIILNGAAIVSASQNQTVSPDIGDQTIRIAGNISALTSQKTSAVAGRAADPIVGESSGTADFRDYRKNIQISGQVPDQKVNDISQFVRESQIAGEFSDAMYLNTTMYSQAAGKIKEQITGKTAELSNIRCPIPVRNHEDMKFPIDFPVNNSKNRKLVSAESKLPFRSIASARNSARLRTSESEIDASTEIVELDTVELLAEHIHFCKICGKGFKRDANLRMHMRAHGNQFKTLEALAKPEQPEGDSGLQIRFSCPFGGCNRNKQHKQFRPLKSAVCVKNHFKRSHCPKMYSCNRCNKKSFSILADLKSHLKHCGQCRWRCSCGTSFSRKDKLFGHVALFEGHMPAIVEEKSKELAGEGEVQMDEDNKQVEILGEISDLGFFDDVLEGFGPISGESFEDWLGFL